MGKRTATHQRPTADEAQLASKVFQTTAQPVGRKNKRSKKQQEQNNGHIQAAWVDEDDVKVQVQLDQQKLLRKLRKDEQDTEVDGRELQQRLKKQFQSGRGNLSWADPKNFVDANPEPTSSDDEDDEERQHTADEVVRSTSKMLVSSSDVLPQGTLDICRLKDANQHAPSNAVIQSVQFHPNGQLLLTAGLDKTLHLFQVDGTTNAKVENVFVKDLPMLDAKFTVGGSRVVLSGPRSYFFSYDLEAGRITKIPGLIGRKEKKLTKFEVSKSGDRMVFLGSDGYLSLASTKSYEWIGNMKMNGDVKSASFCDNDRYLLSTGSDGQVYKWDLRTRKCVFVHQDEGSLSSGAIAASADNKYYAVGSDSGVVNVYNHGGLSAQDKPRKALMNLTTRIDNLKFSSDSQILAMASKDTKDALKFVHLPSFTVFANWPTARTPLNYVSAMDFSPSNGFFAVGNAKGRVLLYRLTHYKTA